MFLKNYFFVIMVFFSISTSAQIRGLESLRSNPNYEVKLLEDSTVEVYNKQQNYRYQKTIKEFPELDNPTEANLIIELDTVNFAAYENLYMQWGSLPAVNSFGKYTSIDANNNGKKEVYVEYVYSIDFFNPYSVVRIYEQAQDSLFNFLYEFPTDTLGDVFDVGDITGDGLLDIFCRGTVNNMRFFKQNAVGDLINTDNFNYNPFPHVYQPDNPTFYDIDNDGNLELIYFLFAGDGDSLWAYSNHVAKYNPQINNYELVYYHRPEPDSYTFGISTGDFDQDGKGNFGTGSIGGIFYIYEYVQGTEYQVELRKELETYNAYLTTMTDDMDGNGKPEIWIGGDFSSSIYGGVTRLFAFESSSSGIYEQVYQIDIRGLSSIINGKMRYNDLDGDGIKDLFLTNANLVFGFKYNNVNKYYMDFIKAIPLLDSSYSNQDLERIDLADLDGDKISEVISQYQLYDQPTQTLKYYSIFYKRDKLTSVNDEKDIDPINFALYNNYPNPFNPVTKIKFALSSVSIIKIKIYSTLGKEIKELLNETRSSGEYEAIWDGTDNKGNKVSSGVYFITMEATPYLMGTVGFRKTIKSILLK